MGLDMYLEGEKWLMTDYENPKKNKKEDGFPLRTKTLELGYWRKHPDLHGFIVTTFADGVDECQRIHLGLDNLNTILSAIEGDALPHTEGFFFGTSRPEYCKESIKIIKNAIKWLSTKQDNVHKTVYYHASW
jgi:hypothetical protein